MIFFSNLLESYFRIIIGLSMDLKYKYFLRLYKIIRGEIKWIFLISKKRIYWCKKMKIVEIIIEGRPRNIFKVSLFFDFFTCYKKFNIGANISIIIILLVYIITQYLNHIQSSKRVSTGVPNF